MSIANNLQNLFTYREAMKTSIKNKGVDSTNAKMCDIAELINKIGMGAPVISEVSWTRSNITTTSTGNPVYGLGIWTVGNYYSTNGMYWISSTGTYPSSECTVMRRHDYSAASGGFIAYTST
jgi:hypothetical protein